MPYIAIEIEPADGTLVGIDKPVLLSWNQSKTQATYHKLGEPTAASGKFTYKSVADLPTGRYSVFLHLIGSGRAAKVTCLDCKLVQPRNSDWPFEIEVPATELEYVKQCSFISGPAL